MLHLSLGSIRCYPNGLNIGVGDSSRDHGGDLGCLTIMMMTSQRKAVDGHLGQVHHGLSILLLDGTIRVVPSTLRWAIVRATDSKYNRASANLGE